MERLDKIISTAKNISRADARSLIKRGRVFVNSRAVTDIGFKADEKSDSFLCDGEELFYNKYIYIMMNKPKGVISASNGKGEKTVVDLVPQEFRRKNLFPAGRLDKDTTGFVLITDDGDFAHKILSPKSHVPKTYIATLDKPFDDEVVESFERGVELKDDLCMPAKLCALDGDATKGVVTIRQGMYHQIKRMFSKFGLQVLELERIKIGGLDLDRSLAAGECKIMSEKEIKIIENKL